MNFHCGKIEKKFSLNLLPLPLLSLELYNLQMKYSRRKKIKNTYLKWSVYTIPTHYFTIPLRDVLIVFKVDESWYYEFQVASNMI